LTRTTYINSQVHRVKNTRIEKMGVCDYYPGYTVNFEHVDLQTSRLSHQYNYVLSRSIFCQILRSWVKVEVTAAKNAGGPVFV